MFLIAFIHLLHSYLGGKSSQKYSKAQVRVGKLSKYVRSQ